MPNHVIKDGIWRSKKLGKLPWKIASLYPWIFLIADDWGRFEYRPHSVWSYVFGSRRDYSDDLPSSDDVALALSEYSRVGLLVRYHMDGDLAAWRKFEGRPPSQRRPSLYPNPVDFVGDILDDDAAWAAWYSDPRPSLGTDLASAYEKPSTSGADQSGSDQSRAGAVPAKKYRVKKAPETDTPELRAYIDTYNRILGCSIGYGDNLRFAARAKEHGYSLELAETIFTAVKNKTTKTAKWCWDNNHKFDYLLRPPYLKRGELTPGPASTIPNELASIRPQAATTGESPIEKRRRLAEEAAKRQAS